MTSLQLLILRTIHRHGPQSDMALWAHTRCEPLKAVIIAAAILAEENFIERTPTHKRPHRFPEANNSVNYWQLTEKGQQFIAALNAAPCNGAECNAQQEVCLGIGSK